jgi:hypothetical protein
MERCRRNFGKRRPQTHCLKKIVLNAEKCLNYRFDAGKNEKKERKPYWEVEGMRSYIT